MKGDRTAPKTADVTLQERFTALQNLPRFFTLVWQTSPLLTLLNILLRLVRSTLPVAVLYIGKLIIDQIIFLSQNPGASQTYVWNLVAAEFGLAEKTGWDPRDHLARPDKAA